MQLEIVRRLKGGIDDRDTERAVQATLQVLGEKYEGAALSVTFVDDQEMRRLNLETRGKDKTTDVLSFPGADQTHAAFPKAADAPDMLGDVVISIPEATRQAKEQGIPLKEELLQLIVHGVLHIAGYDHEKPEDEDVMMALQDKIIRNLLK